MINLISTQARRRVVRGPMKVFQNLTRGLDAIGYPYVVNHAFNSTRRLWIHDDLAALRYLDRSDGAAVVVGPNLYHYPPDIPSEINLRGCLYVQPSQWVVKGWIDAGFDRCPLVAWPVGIDTDAVQPRIGTKKDGLLVYHKGRSEADLKRIVGLLEGDGHSVTVLRYGKHQEREFADAVSTSKVVVWHASYESQGIALQETLAQDVPLVVLDWCEYAGGYDRSLGTSIPYWDDRCGVVVFEPTQVAEAVEHVLSNRSGYAPRDFVREHLSLDGQARAFVQLWEHLGMSSASGFEETLRSEQRWRRPIREEFRQERLEAVWRGAVRRLRRS